MIRLAPVPAYFYQGDSEFGSKTAWRMCFSSSCAMLVEQQRPGKLAGHGQPDDYYLSALNALKAGDTTEYTAQIMTLQRFGVTADFTTMGVWSDIERQLSRGRGVPIGILHHGHVSNPSGGGHWIFVIGIDNDHVYVHDPAGELDVENGGYLDSSPGAGRNIRYTKKNLGPRWMVRGTLGWAILAR